MQQQSAAFAMVGSHASAAECAERLRDHSNSRIASDHKLLAAQTACIYWLAEANKDKYIDAWDRQIELFPSSVAGNQGIWIQLEHASNLASLGESLTETLESLFANSNLEEHSNYIEIGKSLTDAWLSSTEDPQIASDHAFSVMTQTWNTVLAKHDDWLSLVNDDAPKQAAINRQVKTFLQWYAAMSYERGDLTTLESLGASYGEKFGYEDGEAENMLRLSANP